MDIHIVISCHFRQRRAGGSGPWHAVISCRPWSHVASPSSSRCHASPKSPPRSQFAQKKNAKSPCLLLLLLLLLPWLPLAKPAVTPPSRPTCTSFPCSWCCTDPELPPTRSLAVFVSSHRSVPHVANWCCRGKAEEMPRGELSTAPLSLLPLPPLSKGHCPPPPRAAHRHQGPPPFALLRWKWHEIKTFTIQWYFYKGVRIDGISQISHRAMAQWKRNDSLSNGAMAQWKKIIETIWYAAVRFMHNMEI